MSADHEYTLAGKFNDDFSIKLEGASAMGRVLGRLKDQRLLIKLRIYREKRSDRQNRYCWGVIVPTIRAWYLETQGEKRTKDEVYVWLRTGLLGHKPIITEMFGMQVITIEGKRFSQMDTKEFAEAVDEIRSQMLEKGCDIPEPKKDNLLTDYIEDK